MVALAVRNISDHSIDMVLQAVAASPTAPSPLPIVATPTANSYSDVESVRVATIVSGDGAVGQADGDAGMAAWAFAGGDEGG